MNSSSSSEYQAYAMPSGFSSMTAGNTPYDIISAHFASRLASNENGYCTPSLLWSGPPSPTSSIDTSKGGDSHDDGNSTTSASEDPSQSAQKGRRANRYKNCSETVLSKRRAQNRANQRAYRKRKEQRLEELQQQLDDMSQKNDALCCAYRLLASECSRLRANQMPVGQPGAPWDLNGSGNLALDMAALNTYRVGPMTASSPVPESYLEFPGSPDKMWNPFSS
ncbi:uncharacterized protein GLRG_09213 [Colletotrichum graminicola M1.001]|uniref:Putative transcription factor kapC n=1 Tax=Colletotrichum graminicola (strain M1.001 / M2 / FGSC 10212) TaxID=645133 RepID=E3QT81_COLGM|nr:uncharacterized protein GLRG_09213 [Colletotrichum graminicola M1.001]EFQ34069.1 hypothetical protein GLRG_09213 [Colletotrichum graminicola M1.001]